MFGTTDEYGLHLKLYYCVAIKFLGRDNDLVVM